MVLSCSAVRVVCHISNGVLIMILHQELKDSFNEQRELNKTLRSALNISNIQVQELTVQVKLLNEQIDYMKRKLFGSSREKME